MKYKHSCIKCKKIYEDDDVDAYYCDLCTEEKNIIAKKIDRQILANGHKEPTSSLKEYDAAPKVRGFMRVRL